MRVPRMSPEEFQDLQKLAGYPFLSEQHAQEFHLRQIQLEAIRTILEGPKITERRRQNKSRRKVS